jgi:hypothetical protein
VEVRVLDVVVRVVVVCGTVSVAVVGVVVCGAVSVAVVGTDAPAVDEDLVVFEPCEPPPHAARTSAATSATAVIRANTRILGI